MGVCLQRRGSMGVCLRRREPVVCVWAVCERTHHLRAAPRLAPPACVLQASSSSPPQAPHMMPVCVCISAHYNDICRAVPWPPMGASSILKATSKLPPAPPSAMRIILDPPDAEAILRLAASAGALAAVDRVTEPTPPSALSGFLHTN